MTWREFKARVEKRLLTWLAELTARLWWRLDERLHPRTKRS